MPVCQEEIVLVVVAVLAVVVLLLVLLFLFLSLQPGVRLGLFYNAGGSGIIE